MKKILLILTAPLLLVDACASVHLAHQDIVSDQSRSIKTNVKPESLSRNIIEPQRQIVIRELSNGEFDLSARFEPVIKDHYRKEPPHIKADPEY